MKYREDFSRAYHRIPHGKGFTYQNHKGTTVRSKRLRAYFESLAIPPAWKQTRISRDKNSHILAFGYDHKGRKQYIYHPQWHSKQALVRSKLLSKLVKNMSVVRKKIERDKKAHFGSKRHVLGHALSVLEQTGIRIGSEVYAEKNNTFGLSTLRRKHLVVDKGEVTLEFVGKSGKEQSYTINDPHMIEALENLDEIPGYDLFQYYDAEGAKYSLSRDEINTYIRSITGLKISAKFFRMWRGSVSACESLLSYSEKAWWRLTKKDVSLSTIMSLRRLETPEVLLKITMFIRMLPR